MNNKIQYKDIMAFHPGYYVAEIIEDMGISQVEFAVRMGTTPKTVSQLVNGQINLSNDMAAKLSSMLGTSVELWLNLQAKYDAKVLEIKRQEEIDKQSEIVVQIDYSYFEKVAKLKKTPALEEKIQNLCGYLKIATLEILAQPDFLVSFRSGIPTLEQKNEINARAWIQTALNFASTIETQKYNESKLKQHLPEIRAMTIQNPEVFLPRLREIFAACGVAFVLLPTLKNSGINGAVKWINSDRVVLAMNDRRTYADTFWFSLFHEIGHVLQQRIKTVFITSNISELEKENKQLEDEADAFAQEYLIPIKDYQAFAPTKYTSNDEIIAFAKKIGVHPGIVVGRMQHDKIIAPNRSSKLRQQYKIIA